MGIAQDIIANREFDNQLKIFAGIPWVLSTSSEKLSIDEETLTEEQKEVLNSFVGRGFMEPSKYGKYTLHPPTEFHPQKKAMWNAAFESAEKRLYEILEPIAELPWRYTQTSSGDYFIWESDLIGGEVELLQKLPEGSIQKRKNGELFIGFRDDDVLYKLTSDGQGFTTNRLHKLVDDKIKSQIEQDKEVLAELPWRFDDRGNLLLSKQIVESLTSNKEQVQEVLLRREIKKEQGNYVVSKPNTVSKLYDAPDGDTDRARIEFYAHIKDSVVRRHQPLMDLPWEYNKELGGFIVGEEEIKNTGLEHIVGDALSLRDGVYSLYYIPNSSLKCDG